jgi:PhnB protein
MAVEGSVPIPGVIVPHLVVRDAAEALSFYVQAFDATVLYRSPSSSGVGEHIHVKMWNSLVQISTEEPAQRWERIEGALLASPETLSGSTCVFQIGVPDVDSAFTRAVDHGAVPALPPTDMFWGDRYGWVRDPFGHVWALSTVREVLTPEQVEDRLRGFAAQMKGQDR